MNRIFVGREVGKVDRTKWKRIPMNGNIWLKAKYGEGRVCTRTKTWKRSLKPDWGKPRILFWKAFSGVTREIEGFVGLREAWS